MSLTSFALVILICLIGGGIALLADNLGRTLGKKRLKLGRMRPRKTAQVFTFLAGAVIPLLSIAAVMWFSADVRKWFAEGPAIIDQRDKLSGEVSSLKSDIANRQKERERLDKENLEKAKQAALLQKKLQDYVAQVQTYSKKVLELSGKLNQMNREMASVTAQYRDLNTRFSALRSQLVVARKDLSQTEKKRSQTQQAFDTLTKQKIEIEQRNIQLDAENVVLEREKELLEGEKERIQKLLDGLSADLTAAQTDFNKQLAVKQRELELAALELDARRAQVRDAKRDLEKMGNIWLDSRKLPMAFRMGQELARVQAPANMTKAQADDQLSRLARAARSEAEQQGAKSRGDIPPAGIMDRFDPDGRLITSEMQRQRIVDRLTGLSEDVVLVATSSLNAFLGEPVSLDVQSFRNPVVFTQGEMVAESRVDGDRPDAEIVAQITEFVTTQVKDAAKEGGMIPTLGVEQGYGVLPQNTLLELVRSARANNRRVRIQAIAPKDIRAGDELTLLYRIR